jgi:glucose-1-phosphate cytidylyltransferase
LKVVILAGGFGTRLSEFTEITPKPMVEIGDRPIIWHIMETYAAHGHKDFFLALGYKSDVFKKYFLNYNTLSSNLMVDLSSGKVTCTKSNKVDWKITLVDTGLNTMTGGRVKRMKSFIGQETFLLTYGDGLSNINLKELLDFHRSHGKMVTISAVRPPARFGELFFEGNKVLQFKEKSQLHEGWINGGYFVIEPELFDLIDDDETMLEREPLEKVAKAGEMMCYFHEDFWQCMDTKRDYELLTKLWCEDIAPWKVHKTL